MKSKKGASHIEMIISFVIFIGFIVFLFTIFNPLKKSINPGISDLVFMNLEDNLTTKLSTVSIKLKENVVFQPGDTCFTVANIPDMDCNSERKIIVKNISRSIMGARINGDNIEAALVNKEPNEQFYTIYCSHELQEYQGNFQQCKQIGNDQYILGIINERNLWSERNLMNFEREYNAKYGEIKNNFIQKVNDFSFIITRVDDGKILFSGDKNPPKSLNVYAKISPIDVLDKDANITKSTINVIVW